MAPRMIQVRSKTTGETALVSDRAFGYFAADYERVDAQPETSPGPAASVAPASPAAPVQPQTSKPNDRRTPAAKTTEEE
jgi:hypothetical protein